MITIGIYRVEKNKNYVTMNRTALNDTRLSWKAKGIIAYMLSMPDDWTFYISELTKHSSDGEKAFRSGLNELKKHGYVKRFPIYNDEKKISHWETVISEVPDLLSQNLQVGNVQVGKVDVGNDVLLSTESLPSTEPKLNTDKKSNIPYSEIIDYLNQKISSSYKHTTKSTRGLIEKRYNEGFTLEDFKQVIDNKTAEWLNDPNMNKYLRPETLFGNKFESYLNQKGGGQSERHKEPELLSQYNFDKQRELKF